MIPGIFVTEGASKSDIGFLMIVEAIFVGILIMPTVLFFKNKPEIPPSYAAHIEKDKFSIALKRLTKNNGFLLLLVSFSAGLGTANSLATLIEQLLTQHACIGHDCCTGVRLITFIVFYVWSVNFC